MDRRIFALAISLMATFGLLSSIGFSDAVTVNAGVSGYLTATFNYSTVTYGSLTAGTLDNAAPNQLTGLYNVSIDANQNYKISADGTDFDDGAGHTFYIGNLTMDTNSTAGDLAVGSGVALTSAPQDIDTYAYTEIANYHGFWLSIPATQFAGSYSSTLTLTYGSA